MVVSDYNAPNAIFRIFYNKIFLFPWISYNTFYYIHAVIIPLVLIPFLYLHSLCRILILINRNQFLNKRLLKIVISIFWTSIFALFALFYTAQNQAQNLAKKQAQDNLRNPKNFSSDTSKLPHSLISLTFSEISKHNTQEDCWLIISTLNYEIVIVIPNTEINSTQVLFRDLSQFTLNTLK